MQPPADALNRELTLFEYGPCSDPEEGAKLYERRQCLQAYLNKGWLTRSFEGEQACLKASHYVGLLPFSSDGGAKLLRIAPKGCRRDPDRGLLHFLQLIALGNGETLPEQLPGGEGQQGADRFLLFLAHHYARLLQELCWRDFRSYYRPEEDELRSRIRGRLRLPVYARLAVRGKPHVLPCRWDEFTVDNWDNRILWAAARRLKQLAGTFDPQAAALLWHPFKQLLPWFSAVAEVPITSYDLRKSRLGRTSRYYRSALAWAELLIRGSDLPIAGGQVPPLVLDANNAFEKFAEVVARAALPDAAAWKCVPKQGSSFLHVGQDVRSRYPDFLLSDPQQVRAVGDAKYKKVLEDAEGAALASGEEVLRRVSIQDDDWNQLYVYMRITGATCGFVVVPFWNLNGPKYEWFPDRFHFHKSPCDSNVHLAVLALNLLQPLTEVKREAAKQLRSWLASSKEG